MRRYLAACFFVFCGSLFAGGCLWALNAADQAQFEKANEAYRTSNFKEAVRLYEALKDHHPHQAVFSFNLGNALFRDGQLGQAILEYERARMASPRDSDIRSNLRYARSLLEYRIEDKRNWYVKAGESLLRYFREQEIRLVLFTTYFIFMAAWIFCLYFRRGEPWGWFRKTLLALVVLSGLLAAAKHVETHVIREAIVVAKQAEVRFGPSLDSQVAFRLGQGLAAYVVDTRQDWSRVLLVNMESGWVQSKDIAEVSNLKS